MNANTSVNTLEYIESIDAVNFKPDISKLEDAQKQFINDRVQKDPDLLKKMASGGLFDEEFRLFIHSNFPSLARELKKFTRKKVSIGEDGTISGKDEAQIGEEEKRLEARNAVIDTIWKNDVIAPLRTKAIEHTIAFEGKRDRILRDIQQFFDITREERTIRVYLENLQSSELNAAHDVILESPKSRNNYLKKIDGINLKELRTISAIEQAVLSSDDKKNVLKQKFYKSLKIASKHLTPEKLVELINQNITNPEEKKTLIQQFVPSIPLSVLIKHGVPDDKQEDFKKEIIKKVLQSRGIEIPDRFEPDHTFLENIMVPTIDNYGLTDLTIEPANIIAIVQKDKQLLRTQRQAIREFLETKEGATEEKELMDLGELNLSEELGASIHDKFVKNATLKTRNTSLEHLQKHGYIEFTIPGENNTLIKQYFKILDIDLGETLASKYLKVVNLTGPDGFLDVEPKDDDSVPGSKLEYKELYGLLKYSHHPVRFFNKEDFDIHKKENQLKELPSIETGGEITKGVLDNFLELHDPEGGKYGLEEGTCFTFESGTGEDKGSGTCRVLSINLEKRKIKLTNSKDAEMDLNVFLMAFKESKAKRIAKFKDTPSMLAFLQQDAHDDIKKGFKESIFKDGKLLENDKSDASEIKLFIGDDKKIVQIHKWSGDQVQITTGELSEEKKDPKNGVDSVERTLKLDHKPAWVGIEEFYQQIVKIKAKPFKQSKNEIPTKAAESTAPKRKFSISGFFESGLSFVQIMGTLKLAKDPILDFLKRNDAEHSAEVALKLYGRFIPEEIRKNFEKKIDKARADSVSKFKDMITGWPHVKKILEKSNVERFELEAAMLYTMEKAGTLYPEKLAELQFSGGQPTYAWYRALGGTPNDALFMSIKRECETNKNPQGEPDPIPFTEERLVEKLLKTQGSDIKELKIPEKDRAKYVIKYKCRGGVDKEFVAAKEKGISEGVKDGEKKLSDEVTVAGKLKSIISALKDSKYAAAFGGFSKLLESNGKREEMYKAAILIALSGVGATLDKEVTSKLPGFSKYPYPPLLFMTSPGDIKLFQNTCLGLMGNNLDLSAALKETDMKKKIEALEKYLNDGDNTKKLAELLSGNDAEHKIFAEKEANNTYYQFYAKISDKVKEHKTSTEGIEKRVYTKKHSAMTWFNQDASYIKGIQINTQTTDLSETGEDNKKFKDALEAYEDLLKAIKGAKSKTEKEKYESRFKYLFERLYIPARLVINNKNKSNAAFVDRMAKAGIDLLATSSAGWTSTKIDIKNPEFQHFRNEQWEKLLSGESLQSEVNKSIAKTQLSIDKIINLGKKNVTPHRRRGYDYDEEDEFGLAT